MPQYTIKVPFEYIERNYTKDNNGRALASVMLPNNAGYPPDYHFMVYDFLVRAEGGYYSIAFDTMYSNKYDFVKKHREAGRRYPRYTSKSLDDIASIFAAVISDRPPPQLWLARFKWYDGYNIGLGYLDSNCRFYPEGPKWNINESSIVQVVTQELLVISEDDLLCPVNSDGATKWKSVVQKYNDELNQANAARISVGELRQCLRADFFEQSAARNQYNVLRNAVNQAVIDSASILNKGIDDMLIEYKHSVELLVTELREAAEPIAEEDPDEDDILQL